MFGTPNSTKLLGILQKMLLIDRDTPTSDMAWSGLERMTEAALKIYTEQQAERIAASGEVGVRWRPAGREWVKERERGGERGGVRES